MELVLFYIFHTAHPIIWKWTKPSHLVEKWVEIELSEFEEINATHFNTISFYEITFITANDRPYFRIDFWCGEKDIFRFEAKLFMTYVQVKVFRPIKYDCHFS